MKLLASVAAMTLALGTASAAETFKSAPIPPELVTPRKVETPIGLLEFSDGVPGTRSAAALYDNLDRTFAFRAFMDNLRGVSIHALRKGMQDMGMKPNEVLIFSHLMDAKSLFLTGKRGQTQLNS